MTGGVEASGSIRRRLTVELVGSAAVLAAVVFLLMQNFARQVAEESQDNILTASVTSILESVAVQNGEITADIPYAALSMLGTVSDDRVFYRIAAAGEVLTGYADLPQAEPGFLTADYKGESVRIVTASRRLSVEGRPVPVRVTVAQTRNGQAATLARISRNALLVGLGFFVVAVGIALIAARSSMRPLDQLTGAVSRRGPKDLRPVTSPVPAEMVPLVRSLNSFIGRLRTSLSRSEDFIAEAAHRVRTPLATVRAQAEVALRRVERPENRASLKEMIRAIDESSRAAGQLLDHAMVTFRTDHLERAELDLRELASDTVERLRPLAELKDIRLTLAEGPRMPIAGDRILIQNAVRNILDNAIKYSPEDSRVTITVAEAPPGPAPAPQANIATERLAAVPPTPEGSHSGALRPSESFPETPPATGRISTTAPASPTSEPMAAFPRHSAAPGDGGHAILTVTDEGTGFPDAPADTLTERFVRGANVASTIGSGLGLTIAKEVVEAHGGTLIFRNRSESPGACVSLSFPT
ncbi:MAG: sensor histidine kinase N-terminal domain-containing protein [Pseudomonadota bacterium]